MFNNQRNRFVELALKAHFLDNSCSKKNFPLNHRSLVFLEHCNRHRHHIQELAHRGRTRLWVLTGSPEANHSARCPPDFYKSTHRQPTTTQMVRKAYVPWVTMVGGCKTMCLWATPTMYGSNCSWMSPKVRNSGTVNTKLSLVAMC